MGKTKGPRILLFDVETSPIIAYVWSLWDQNVALNQIKSDWHILSWSAKWLGDKPNKTMYMDQRNAKNIEDDSKIMKELWKLLDEADCVITQNGKKFDVKKVNTRFILHGMSPPSSYKHIDTLQLAKRHFGFSSNRLEYLTDKLCTKYKKGKHKQFSGFELWKACLNGNIKAWKEMEEYNKLDVLSLEELYNKMEPWGTNVNTKIYKGHGAPEECGACGGGDLKKHGFSFPASGGKIQRYKCKDCGAEYTDLTVQGR